MQLAPQSTYSILRDTYAILQARRQMKLLRFTLRDLFWLAVVVGLAVGWWADRSNLATQNGTLKTDNREMKEILDDFFKRAMGRA